MRFKLSIALALPLLEGCHSAAPTPQEQQTAAIKALHSDRLKRSEIAGVSPLVVDPDGSLGADGIWIPEPDDSAHALAFPEQTHIDCDKGEQNCIEMEIRFVVVGNIITVKGPEETIWPIKSWDKNSLLAAYGAFPGTRPDEKCYSHTLSIVFASQTVTTSDVPTHGPGCEGFEETNSYRLAYGSYDVDVSPKNDTIPDTTPHK
jgi:hypothetical protein